MKSRIRDFFYKPLGLINAAIGRLFRLRVMPHANLYPWQIRPQYGPSWRKGTVSEGDAAYLRSTNPRLIELTSAYRKVDADATRPAVWVDGKLSDEELLHFRGQNPYMNQLSGLNFNELSYALSYYALKASSATDLIERLDEDGSFGVHTFQFDQRTVSRDLLDSAREIDFLRRHVGLGAPDTNILDIGAGYGRLAHRLNQATGNNVRIFATDAFAPSTFLAEYYLKVRNAERTRVVPLHEIDAFLAETKINVATNVHSFSECRLEAVEWWVSRLAKHNVRHLFIVPNKIEDHSGAALTNRDEPIEPIFERHGYRLQLREWRYVDRAVARYAVDPALFSLFVMGDT